MLQVSGSRLTVSVTGGADGQACRHYRANPGQVPSESRGGAPPERSGGSARFVGRFLIVNTTRWFHLFWRPDKN
jgi:hypothetical protein